MQPWKFTLLYTLLLAGSGSCLPAASRPTALSIRADETQPALKQANVKTTAVQASSPKVPTADGKPDPKKDPKKGMVCLHHSKKTELCDLEIDITSIKEAAKKAAKQAGRQVWSKIKEKAKQKIKEKFSKDKKPSSDKSSQTTDDDDDFGLSDEEFDAMKYSG